MKPPPIKLDKERGEVITETLANKVWDILCIHAGATEHDRDSWLAYAVGRSEISEYRFRGVFGFGGKVRKLSAHDDGHWHVYYYPEDKTPEREKARHQVNSLLSLL